MVVVVVQEAVIQDVQVVLDALDVDLLVQETAGPHVQMVAHLDALKIVEAAVQVVPVLVVDHVLDHVEVTVRADAETVVPLVVEVHVQEVVHHAPDVKDLALAHVGLVALDNAEDVVITVLLHALLTVALLVLEHAMVVFQIQFNKIVY